MESLFFKKSRSPSEAAAEVIDIDVTPVMNVFIILIPFLISMAVFTHLSIIEFSLPPNVGVGLDEAAGKPKLKLTIVVAKKYLAISHGENLLDSIPVNGNEYEELYKKLLARRETADIRDELVVAVADAIPFQQVINVMDRCRDAGFEKVGLSSAPEEAERL